MMMHLTGNAEGLIISKMKDKVKTDGYQSVACDPVGQPVGETLYAFMPGGCHDPRGGAHGPWCLALTVIVFILFWLNIKFTILTISHF